MSLFVTVFAALLATAPERMPSDFEAKLLWSEGSSVPASHYEYRIAVNARGHGSIVMILGYPTAFDDYPKWKVDLAVTLGQAENVYALFEKARKDRSETRRAPCVKGGNRKKPSCQPSINDKEGTIGGPRCSITVVSNHELFQLPCDPSKLERSVGRESLENALLETVPNEVMDRLQRQRLDYSEKK